MGMGKGEETRERILDRAVSLASQIGLDGLTVGTLAAELGLSKSGLFAHFGSKDSLQVNVLQAAAERFEHVVVRPALKAARGEPRLRALFERWMEWANSPSMPGGCVFVTAAIELDDRPGPARDFLVATQQQLLATLAKAVRLAQQTRHFREDLDPDQLAFEVYGMMLGYNHAKRLLRDPRADERLRNAFDRLLASAHP
jgi:AcrR family transcriptional regulator